MSTKEELNDPGQKLKRVIEENVDTEKLKKQFDVSNFDLNAVLRGAQLTLVGAHRALQNPALFTNEHYRQAAIAVGVGVGIRLIVAVPILGIRIFMWLLSFVIDLQRVSWDDSVLEGLRFVGEYVLQIPFFVMALMRYIVPTLDNVFMQSLQWVDVTYMEKHKTEASDTLRDLYYPNLNAYPVRDGTTHKKSFADSIRLFIWRFGRKGLISLVVFLASYLPLVGRFVLPGASFYTFNEAVGLGPASLIFGTGLFLPRRYLVIFLQSYFACRSLMRELLEPYFARIHLTKEQKRAWFRSRGGVLFGFGLGFYALVKIPLVGVLIYGVAEASTAYLITKITDPPPPPKESEGFAASQQVWTNKMEFLNLSLSNLDGVRKQNAGKVASKEL